MTTFISESHDISVPVKHILLFIIDYIHLLTCYVLVTIVGTGEIAWVECALRNMNEGIAIYRDEEAAGAGVWGVGN